MAIQKMRLLVPPTLRELREDPIYARYIGRNPRLPENVRGGMPWQIVARRHVEAPGSTWALKLMPSYADAYRRVLRMIEDTQWEDMAIVSRRTLFKPPVGFTWDEGRFRWCGRCRRPTLFRFMRSHPALKNAPVLTDDEPFRCYYCGMRQVAQPTFSRRTA